MSERRARLPGAPDSDTEQIVMHVDMDCFYAACERLREPELEGEPVVVGMGYEADDPSGAVATASYEAREYGIESAQGISTALDQLPRAVDADSDEPSAYYRPVDMEYYESVAEEVQEILGDLADTVRAVSIDEAYLDVTERTEWGVADGYARHIKDRIAREVGVTASVGVAPTMSAAKVASDRDKPDGLVVVEPGEVQAFFEPLDVEDVHGVGPVTAAKLRDSGIETAGDLAAADPTNLEAEFGERGREFHQRARGVDPRTVTPTGRPKSLSRESSLGDPTEDFQTIQQRVRTLAQAVADRAERRGASYRTIGVKVVEPPFDINTREQSLPGPVQDAPLLEATAMELLQEFNDRTVRKVGVRVSNLSFSEGEQAQLSTWADAEAAETVTDRQFGGQSSLWEFGEDDNGF